jgi:hypothetical protein
MGGSTPTVNIKTDVETTGVVNTELSVCLNKSFNLKPREPEQPNVVYKVDKINDVAIQFSGDSSINGEDYAYYDAAVTINDTQQNVLILNDFLTGTDSTTTTALIPTLTDSGLKYSFNQYEVSLSYSNNELSNISADPLDGLPNYLEITIPEIVHIETVSYSLLYEKTVGCGIDMSQILSSKQGRHVTLWGIDGNSTNGNSGTWVPIPTRFSDEDPLIDEGADIDIVYAVVKFEKDDNDVSCMGKHILKIDLFNRCLANGSNQKTELNGHKFYCDTLLCINNCFGVNPCKIRNGCDNFCVKLYEQSVSDDILEAIIIDG